MALPTSPRSSTAIVRPADVATPIPTPTPTSPLAPSTTPPTQDLIEFFAARVDEDPDDGDAQLQLGLALLQRIRETADPSLYPPTEAALGAARRLRPDDPLPLIGLGGVLLGKHEFADALRIGQEAETLDPSSSGAGAVVVDALIELGRYEEAFASVDRLVARSADLTSLTGCRMPASCRGICRGRSTRCRRPRQRWAWRPRTPHSPSPSSATSNDRTATRHRPAGV